MDVREKRRFRNRRFDKQNKILDEQNVILAKLLELLEGKE